MTQIVGIPKNISSTEIRELKSLEVDKRVIDYIVSNNLYFMPKIRHFLSEKRLTHSVSVAKLAYDIAEIHGIDRPDRYFIAGLLHDIGKEMKMDEQNRIMAELYKPYSILPKVLYHQFVGAELTKKVFGIVDEEILDAIMYHATGKKDMSMMGKVLYASDKIEPTRGFDSSDLINEMMKNIDRGFKIVLQANKEYLTDHRGDILNMLTYQCFKQYL